jgi:hypothetical protein
MSANQPNPTLAETATRAPPAEPGEFAERRLRGLPYLALKNVSCAYRDGVLTLRGWLPTYYLKQLAQAAVAQIEGVGRIDNRIEVLAPARRDAGRA